MIFRTGLLFILLILNSHLILANEVASMELRYEQWELFRHGEKILTITELKELVIAWSENTDKILEMHYPGGEQGELWVRELMDWLIALGVPSGSIYAVPGSGNEDIIKILLVQGKQTNE